MVKLNEYQTAIIDLNLHSYPQEVQDEFRHRFKDGQIDE